MMYNLNFLDNGETFPPFDERQRLNKYRNSKLLYEGQHDHVFHRWAMTEGVEDLTIIVNWHRRLSVLWADMLFGQPPELKADNQEVLDDIIHDNDFYNVLYEAAIDVSRLGTGILKARVEDGKAKIEAVPADIWFPIVDPKNVKKVDKHVLAWRWEEDDENFLSVEIHEKGKVEYRTYSLMKDMAVGRLLEQEEEVTGVDAFLIRPVQNITTSDSIVGTNDYDDINNLLEEIEMRLTQISRVLDKHSDPSMYGDETALEFDERTGEYVVRGGGKFYPVSDDSVKPGYITWDANLADSQEHVKTLMKQFYVITNTSPAAFGQLESGLAESGSALKRLLMTTIIKSNRMKLRFSSLIKEMLELSGELQSRNGGLNVGKVSVEFRDSLPEDSNEMVQQEVQRKSANLTSTESSIGRLDGISGEALAEELTKIDRESNNE